MELSWELTEPQVLQESMELFWELTEPQVLLGTQVRQVLPVAQD